MQPSSALILCVEGETERIKMKDKDIYTFLELKQMCSQVWFLKCVLYPPKALHPMSLTNHYEDL